MTLQGWLVLSNTEVREQFLALDFPLTSLGEGLLLMALPMGLSALGVIAGICGLRAHRGSLGLLVVLSSWLAVFVLVGTEGFQYLF